MDISFKKMKMLTRTLILLGVTAALGLVLQILMLPEVGVIPTYDQQVVLKICIDAILALGLNLITGITGQFSLGHAGFMSLGAYASAFYILRSSADGQVDVGSMLVALLLGGAVAGIVGLLIGIPTLRLKGDYLAIATLGFGEIVRVLIENSGPDTFNGAAGLSGIPLYTNFLAVFIALAITFFFIRNMMKSSFGRACVAVREDEIAAESMGVNLTRTKVMAFVIGAFFAGVAGALYSGFIGSIQPKDFGFMKSIDILMIVVLGGLGNIWGTVIAAVLLNIVSTMLQDFAEIRMIIYAALLIIIMLVKSGETPFFVRIRKALGDGKDFVFGLIKKLFKRPAKGADGASK